MPPYLKKGSLVSISFFNFKIFVTLGLLSLVLSIEFQLFKDNFYIDKLNDNILVFKDIFISKKESLIKTKFLPSDYFLAFFIGASFIGAFLFNVAPYGTFQQRIITWDNTKNSILFLFKNHPVLSSIFLIFIFSLKWIVQSRPILGGLFFLMLSLLVIKTYDSVLLFGRRIQIILTSTAVISQCYPVSFYGNTQFLYKKFSFNRNRENQGRGFSGKNIFKRDPLGKLTHYSRIQKFAKRT